MGAGGQGDREWNRDDRTVTKAAFDKIAAGLTEALAAVRGVEIVGQDAGAEQASYSQPARRTRKGTATNEGHGSAAEQAGTQTPSPRRRTRGGDQIADRGAKRAAPNRPPRRRPTPAPEMARDQSSEVGQSVAAEQAIVGPPASLDTTIAEIIALASQRRLAIKSQSRCDRSCEAYLARAAGYRPKLAPDGTKLLDEKGKPVRDKEGKKLWAEVKSVRLLVERRVSGKPDRGEGRQKVAEQAGTTTPPLPVWADTDIIIASMQSRQVWDNLRAAAEKHMEERARQLPVWPWVDQVRGAGALGLAILVGEAGNLGSYRDKSALWKRLGLAVIGGIRQQKISGAAALEHGYSPTRRAECWVLADSLGRAQRRADRDEDGNDPKKSGKSVAVPGHALGPYGEHYSRRRAHLIVARPDITPAHQHAEATRYAFKAFIRDLRAAWRAQ